MFGKKRDMNTAVAAEPEEKRATQDIAKADDGLQVVDGDFERSLVPNPHQYGLALFRQVAPLTRHVERIEVTFHPGAFVTASSR